MHFTNSLKRAAGDVSDAAERDVEDLTAKALDKANDGMSFRDDVRPAIDAVATSAHDVADHARERALQARDRARDQALDLADRTSDYVNEKPLQALALAAAAGAVLALLLGKRR